MGTTTTLSSTTRSKISHHNVLQLSNALHSYHSSFHLDPVITSILSLFSSIHPEGKQPKYLSAGGSERENSALLHLERRLKMILSYLCGQLFPWIRGNPSNVLLVIGSACFNDLLSGNIVKYDDSSSADLNPIGNINKEDLIKMMKYLRKEYDIAIVDDILDSNSTVSITASPSVSCFWEFILFFR
jgi:NAD+ synthase (glutamine-hydrolysing)